MFTLPGAAVTPLFPTATFQHLEGRNAGKIDETEGVWQPRSLFKLNYNTSSLCFVDYTCSINIINFNINPLR